jgi:hypothetical protein
MRRLSKQATVEAIIRIHNKRYNGSKLSLNSFELLNDRLHCSYVNFYFYPTFFSCWCYIKLWAIRYKLFSIIQVCQLPLLSQLLRALMTQWRHAVASVDRKMDRLKSWPTLIMSKTRLYQQQFSVWIEPINAGHFQKELSTCNLMKSLFVSYLEKQNQLRS